MTQTDALKLALEALEECKRDPRLKYEHPTYEKAITTIKEALAQPAVTESHKQRSVSEHLEPVAWRVRWPKVGGGHAWVMNDAPLMAEHGFVNEPLYTTPPPVTESHKRKPLTDEEIEIIDRAICGDREFCRAFVRAIEAEHGITASEAEDSARSKT